MNFLEESEPAPKQSMAVAEPVLLSCERTAAQLNVSELRAALLAQGVAPTGGKKKLLAALAEVAAPAALFRCSRTPASLTVKELRVVLAERGVVTKGLKKKELVALLQ